MAYEVKAYKNCAIFGQPCIVIRKIWPGSTQLSRYVQGGPKK